MDELAVTPEELAAVAEAFGVAPSVEEAPAAPMPSAPPRAASPANQSAIPQSLIDGLVASASNAPPAPSGPFTPPPAPKPVVESSVTAHPAQFAPLKPAAQATSPSNLDLLLGVSLRVAVELGRTRMEIKEVLQLGPGSVVELDKQAGEPVDILVNDRVIARGEVVVVDDRFGVRITEVLSPADRVTSLRGD